MSCNCTGNCRRYGSCFGRPRDYFAPFTVRLATLDGEHWFNPETTTPMVDADLYGEESGND